MSAMVNAPNLSSALVQKFSDVHQDAYPFRSVSVPAIPYDFDAELFLRIMSNLKELVEAIGSDDEMAYTCAHEAAREIKRCLLGRTK
ncbi:MAG: hypothetical protein P8Q26_13915 [Ascidiaceihabitans sp.]|nr:hypothetical protein [Ascidiaceihabitans sp.]